MPLVRFGVVSLLLFLHIQLFALDAFIRINQLGYTPNSIKKAILLSESKMGIQSFSIHDALTDAKLQEFSSVQDLGAFEQFASVYSLDFSGFKTEGAFYIKANHSFSPTVYIDKGIYKSSADFLLNYLRQQRCGYNPVINAYCHQHDGAVVPLPASTIPVGSAAKKSKNQSPEIKQKNIDASGGWHDASDYLKYGTTSAAAVFQLMYAYKMNPGVFADNFDANGLAYPNNIPDVLDEAKWGLDWLVKLYPEPEELYFQVADDRDHASFRMPNDDQVDYGWGEGKERPAYRATGKPEGLLKFKNRTTGIASIAGKYAAAFALGADLLRDYYPTFANDIEKKAFNAYEYGKKYPGVCQTAPCKAPYFYEEDNWADDMQLAATQLYGLSFEQKYQSEAAAFGRLEPIIPWLFSDTVNHYQWFPFTNYGHFVLANSENPEFKNEFLQNIRFGLKRAELRKSNNPFGIGVPMLWCSNNYITALATQCNLYRRYTRDSAFIYMETALVDWLFGCNPWGVSMVVGLPDGGRTARDTHSAFSHEKGILQKGGLVDGPVRKSIFDNLIGVKLSKPDVFKPFQTKWAVYHDDYADYSTNEPTMDGTASLVYLMSALQYENSANTDNNVYSAGGIIRTNKEKKQISLIFTAHEYADGAKRILKTLEKQHVKASFFLTGDFFRIRKYRSIIKDIAKCGHYIGPHSDQHIQYCSFENRNSMLVDKATFVEDIKQNYAELQRFGIEKQQARYFVPPFEWYNDSISAWARDAGLILINFTPGTRSNADYTIPEMREKYFSSDEIYSQIMKVESAEGLNGHIMLFHLGTSPQRTDKFYNRLNELLVELKSKGYKFVDLEEATGGKAKVITGAKAKKGKH